MLILNDSQLTKSKDANSELQWTSLRGNDRKKLLSKLPPSIPSIITDSNGLKIKKLWMVINKNNDINIFYTITQ